MAMLPEKQCTGCGVCAACCPKTCISMKTDREGFRYPCIDMNTCVDCHACERVCPVLRPMRSNVLGRAVGANNREDAVRQNSSSGGVFFALAKAVLDVGGCVCGASYDAEFVAQHCIVESIDELEKLQGAKYVQSKAEHCFAPLKTALDGGRRVLFSGTPCQVAGFRQYLGKDYDNLLLADLICHGVPSPTVWKQYLEERRQTDAAGAAIKAVNFRSKVSGWSRYQYSVVIVYADGHEYCVPQAQDAYLRGFVQNLYLRPSCAVCTFKGDRRYSDLTLGDFWGVWDTHAQLDDNKGTSLLLINSGKGNTAWTAVAAGFVAKDVETQEALAYNPSALKPSVPHDKRADFFEKLQAGATVSACVKKCFEVPPPTLFQRIKNKLMRK